MGAYERGPITQKGTGGGHARVDESWGGMLDGTTCNSIHPNFIKVCAIPLADDPKGAGKIHNKGCLMPKIFVKFQPLLGGHSGAKITNYEDLNQKQIDPIRFQELVEQYYSTNDPDLRQNIASDLFKEFGALVWA